MGDDRHVAPHTHAPRLDRAAHAKRGDARRHQEGGRRFGPVQQAGGAAIHDKLYTAYFVDGRNIGDIEVLVDISASAGLSGDDARRVLEDRSFKDAVDADWEKARKSGVTGVPTFVSGGAGVVGAQPYEALEKLVKDAGATAKS